MRLPSHYRNNIASNEFFSCLKGPDDPYMIFMYVSVQNVKLVTHLFSICAVSSQPE